MMKPATVAFMCLALWPCHAQSDPMDGKPVPLFPNLTWGLPEQVALSKGLTTYTKHKPEATVTGLPSITIGNIDFSAQAVFGEKVDKSRSGLTSIVLQHEGFVPKVKYENFIRLITRGFLYAGQGSDINELASFYNAINKESSLVITTLDRETPVLSVVIAPGLSR